MMGFIRFILAMVVAFVGWNACARLQVFEPATLVMNDAAATTYKGRVSRELLTGDWLVEVYPHVRMMVSAEKFGALAYQGSGLNASALSAVTAGFVAAFFIGAPDLAKVLIDALRARLARRGRPAPR